MVHHMQHGHEVILACWKLHALGEFANRELQAGVAVQQPQETSGAHGILESILLLQGLDGEIIRGLIGFGENTKVGGKRSGILALVSGRQQSCYYVPRVLCSELQQELLE